MGFFDMSTSKAPAFFHEDLIARRVHARPTGNFWDFPALPDGIKVHDKPLAFVGGLPNHGFFPVTSIDVGLSSKPFGFDKAKTFSIPQVSERADLIDLKGGLQYADAGGFPQLCKFTAQFVERVIKPKSSLWWTIMTLGGADGVNKCLDVLVNPGDSVLFEEFTFSPILKYCLAKGGIPVPIKLKKVMAAETTGQMDFVDELTDMLENWDERYPDKKLPKVFYTIPNGHNPLGVGQTLEHKKKVYALAEKYNFFLIEDDPYGYLNFSPEAEEMNLELSNDQFINSLRPSFLTLDTTGRVVRVETFSKIFAPGCRLGFAVAHPKFISYLESSSPASPSGMTQSIVFDGIQRMGGLEGWIHWITLVRNEYLKRKNTMVRTLLKTEAAKKGYISVMDPACGMFVACKINIKEKNKIPGLEKFYVKGREVGVIAVLGHKMAVDPEFSAERCNFLRISISAADDLGVLEEGAKRISAAAVKYFED